MKYLGIDPGSKKCGWAVVDLDRKIVVKHGHDDLNEMRNIIQGYVYSIDGIVIEMLMMYKISNPNDVLPTAYTIGRLQEMAHDAFKEMNANGVNHKVEMLEFTRPEVIFRLTGRWPGRAHRVSKAELQEIVKNLLGLEKVCRPQHANDAVALILAHTMPVPAIISKKKSNVKTNSKQRKSKGKKP